MKKSWIIFIIIITLFGVRFISELPGSEFSSWRLRSQPDAEIIREVETYIMRQNPVIFDILKLIEEREPILYVQIFAEAILLYRDRRTADEIANATRSHISTLFQRISYLNDENLSRYLEIAIRQGNILHKEGQYQVCFRMATRIELGSLNLGDPAFHAYELEMMNIITDPNLVESEFRYIHEWELDRVMEMIFDQIIHKYGEGNVILWALDVETRARGGIIENPSRYSCLIVMEMLSGMLTHIDSGNGDVVRQMLFIR